MIEEVDVDTSQIKKWRSIITLLVFVGTNIIVLFPFHISIYVPRFLSNAFLKVLIVLRIISPRPQRSNHGDNTFFARYRFPLDFVTAPIIADLFLLAILAIGRQEVHDGTVGANNISPIDIMAFFLTLAYIAISIDASGLIRYLAFKVLQKGGGHGHRLFFYLYAFFFSLGTFIGNDPIILSGTAFLAYMTRVSSNIKRPRAWIYTQFAIANVASAILVSSNPTNLVLAGAFQIKFVHYTANMVVPVVVTMIVLFPFLLYVVFPDKALIPRVIEMHELPRELKEKKPINPNIRGARGAVEEEENEPGNEEQNNLLSLEEIMNPFLDKGGAGFGAVIMTATLVTLLALNAASQTSNEHPVFWVTVPAAFVMFCWDVWFGWQHRHETRELARKGRQELAESRAVKVVEMKQAPPDIVGPDAVAASDPAPTKMYLPDVPTHSQTSAGANSLTHSGADGEKEVARASDDTSTHAQALSVSENGKAQTTSSSPLESTPTMLKPRDSHLQKGPSSTSVVSNPASSGELGEKKGASYEEARDPEKHTSHEDAHQKQHSHTTLQSLTSDMIMWLQDTFPTVMAVMAHLPFKLVPFALAMFVLVQALVTKGWVAVFAYGWDHWVKKTGTVGSIGGMGFLSVILCNFAGTNIGTTILLSRVIQAWAQIHVNTGEPISDRTFWATVYSMALGVNYGAFSMAFSASLAGLLWRDILARKHIRIRRLDFARVNLPIIAIAMTVGCAVLVAEIYIVRKKTPYHLA